ncbi:MAG: hypothetical protein QXH75_01050 [Sulfolobaceae archaeon]
MIFQYSDGVIQSQFGSCKIVREKGEIKIEGDYNILLKRKTFNKYDIIQYNSKVGELKVLNLKYGMYNFYISRPQVVGFIRGYQDSVKIFTTGNTEIGEIKRTQNGLEGYLNDSYDPYVIIIYLAILSPYAKPIPYAPYRPSRTGRYRGLFYFIPLLLILIFLLPFPYYIDLVIYIILLGLLYYFLIIRRAV